MPVALVDGLYVEVDAEPGTGLAADISVTQVGEAQSAGAEVHLIQILAVFVGGGDEGAGNLGVVLARWRRAMWCRRWW